MRPYPQDVQWRIRSSNRNASLIVTVSKCIAVSEMAVEVKNNENAQLSQTADISKSLAAPRREHDAVVQAWPWLEFCVLLFCLSCHMTDEI